MEYLHCYVDETGQDTGSDYFIVVAVLFLHKQEELRQELIELETRSKVGQRKWHKSHFERSIAFLESVQRQGICSGTLYVGRYKKPLPFFLPVLDTVSKAIKEHQNSNTRVRVVIDGIDKKKASEMTNALRLQGIRLDFVKSQRDESEPFLRLADRWAGCIRAGSLGKRQSQQLYVNAQQSGYIKIITK